MYAVTYHISQIHAFAPISRRERELQIVRSKCVILNCGIYAFIEKLLIAVEIPEKISKNDKLWGTHTRKASATYSVIPNHSLKSGVEQII